jgi:excisionase family DNA binding protein
MFTQGKQTDTVYFVRSDGEAVAVMTMAEVAACLRLHRSTVQRFAKSGELPSHKIGGRRLFWASDVREFFENRKVTREDGC